MENDVELLIIFLDKGFTKTTSMNFKKDDILKLQELEPQRRKEYWMTYANKLAGEILRQFPKNFKSWEAFTKVIEKYFKRAEKLAKKNDKMNMEDVMKNAPVFESTMDVKDIRIIFARKNFQINIANNPEDAIKKFMLIINEIKV
jgi:hypothetical protein